MNIKQALKHSETLLYLNDTVREFYYKFIISDEKLISNRFFNRLGREVNLSNPEKFNDKLQWLKLYWYNPMASICADKYEVREFIQEEIGEQYLNKLLAVYESVDEIDLDKLPKSFVLKCTHGSGYNIICNDKDNINWKVVFRRMRRWLKQKYYLLSQEWIYKDIKPRIICEEYLSDTTGNPPKDYKIFCFHGNPELIQVDVDRFGSHIQNFYTPEWEVKDIEIEKQSDSNINIKKPESLNEMLSLSRKLSNFFPHVRVDFYEVNTEVIFGELTFFHHSGFGKFNPPEFELEFGSYLKLPNLDKG